MANKYYAVKNGRNVGIYTTWPECEKQVKGFSGAVYKSFSSEEDAQNFICPVAYKKLEYGINIYVDGSYNSDTNEYGYGCFIDFGTHQQLLCGRGKCEYNGRNVEGEVAGALAAIKHLSSEERPIVIYHDYEGVGKWADKLWKANTYYTKNYANFY